MYNQVNGAWTGFSYSCEDLKYHLVRFEVFEMTSHTNNLLFIKSKVLSPRSEFILFKCLKQYVFQCNLVTHL